MYGNIFFIIFSEIGGLPELFPNSFSRFGGSNLGIFRLRFNFYRRRVNRYTPQLLLQLLLQTSLHLPSRLYHRFFILSLLFRLYHHWYLLESAQTCLHGHIFDVSLFVQYVMWLRTHLILCLTLHSEFIALFSLEPLCVVQIFSYQINLQISISLRHAYGP